MLIFNFDGADAEGMQAHKLLGRMENTCWEPPLLSFTLERHGGTVLGSTRAELHYWQVNIETSTATCSSGGHRQLTPMQPKLNVKPLADELVSLILMGQRDDRLKWNTDGSVRLMIGKIIPSDSVVRQTLQGRRKRLNKEVEQLLASHGWRKVKASHRAEAPARLHPLHLLQQLKGFMHFVQLGVDLFLGRTEQALHLPQR